MPTQQSQSRSQSQKPVSFILLRTAQPTGATSVILNPKASRVSNAPLPGLFTVGPVRKGDEGEYTCIYQISKKRGLVNSTASNAIEIIVAGENVLVEILQVLSFLFVLWYLGMNLHQQDVLLEHSLVFFRQSAGAQPRSSAADRCVALALHRVCCLPWCHVLPLPGRQWSSCCHPKGSSNPASGDVRPPCPRLLSGFVRVPIQRPAGQHVEQFRKKHLSVCNKR